MCIFCDIVDKKIPSYTIYEDDIVKCFLDLDQSCLGHILVIPKEHTLNIDSVSNDTLNHIFNIIRMLKKHLEDKLNIDGLSILQNNGIAQEVKHLHFHLLPKYENKPENIDSEKLCELLKVTNWSEPHFEYFKKKWL